MSTDAITALRQTISRLRNPNGGCPWDIEQTHQTLTRCLIDEVSELLETIDNNDLPHMREELGDVLIQIIFHSEIASETGAFTLDDVAREVNEKLIRRHPHVFGTSTADTTEKVLAQWDQIKAAEKKSSTAPTTGTSTHFKHLPPRLPALMFAEAVWKQIQKQKLPAPDGTSTAISKITGTLTAESLGEQLFNLAAAAREKNLDPESALRLHAQKIMRHADQQKNTTGTST